MDPNPSAPAERSARPYNPLWHELSPQDELFLQLEQPKSPMHVGALLVLDGSLPKRPRGGTDIARIRRNIDSRLDALPAYRRRLAATPVGRKPIWVDDYLFDVKRHVNHIALPEPGDDEELRLLAERSFSQPIDRGQPLWQIDIVDGLRRGSTALMAKVHHSLVDGVGGCHLLTALLDAESRPQRYGPSLWAPRRAPSSMELLFGEAQSGFQALRSGAFQIAETLRSPADAMRNLSNSGGALAELLAEGVNGAPASPLNRPHCGERAFDWLSLDLAEVKRVKAHLGGTINDVVLSVVARGLRSFLLDHREQSTVANLRALLPVSLRASENCNAYGNFVGGMLVTLPLRQTDPARCHAAVCETTRSAKASGQIRGSEMLMALSGPLVGVGAALIQRLQPFNLMITNVPGPQFPLYLDGVEVKALYPHVPLFPNQGLAVAVISYNGKLCVGLTADRAAVPDLNVLVRSLVRAFDELRGLATPHEVRPASERPVRSIVRETAAAVNG